MKGLICLFKGHELDFARYRSPMENVIPSSMAQHWDGSITINPATSWGFMHFGLVADCQRCGKQIDADNLNLQVLEPNFGVAAVSRAPYKEAQRAKNQAARMFLDNLTSGVH